MFAQLRLQSNPKDHLMDFPKSNHSALNHEANVFSYAPDYNKPEWQSYSPKNG